MFLQLPTRISINKFVFFFPPLARHSSDIFQFPRESHLHLRPHSNQSIPILFFSSSSSRLSASSHHAHLPPLTILPHLPSFTSHHLSPPTIFPHPPSFTTHHLSPPTIFHHPPSFTTHHLPLPRFLTFHFSSFLYSSTPNLNAARHPTSVFITAIFIIPVKFPVHSPTSSVFSFKNSIRFPTESSIWFHCSFFFHPAKFIRITIYSCCENHALLPFNPYDDAVSFSPTFKTTPVYYHSM